MHEGFDDVFVGIVDARLEIVHKIIHACDGDTTKIVVDKCDDGFGALLSILPVGVVVHFGHEVLDFLGNIDFGFIFEQVDSLLFSLFGLTAELNLGSFFLLRQGFHFLELSFHRNISISFEIKLDLLSDVGINFLNQINTALFAELDLEAFVGEQNRLANGNVVD